MKTEPKSQDYRLGCLYAIWTTILIAAQEPLSVLAAKRLSSSAFVGLTQFALLLSVLLLTLSGRIRRDFFAVLTNPRHFGRLLILFFIGVAGLLLYNLGLGSAHPITVAVILNLSPFWAALVARVISRKGIPVSPPIFLLCFALGFLGSMAVAWSQMEHSTGQLVEEIAQDFWRRNWMFAIPVPIFFALSGTLVGHWFSDYDEVSAVAANFVVSAMILIPICVATSNFKVAVDEETFASILLLMLGTIVAAVGGRVYYQIALTKTGNDNGFVTMFFLLIPGLTALISLPLSHWISDLRFLLNPMFFVGMALITASLFLFSSQAFRRLEKSLSAIKVSNN
jgi:drug/metabolite transporter (DMT)-like permease